jgi:hypothetical protein
LVDSNGVPPSPFAISCCRGGSRKQPWPQIATNPGHLLGRLSTTWKFPPNGGTLFASAVVSCHFGVVYLTSTKSYVDVAAYANGHALLPFQYRALSAWIIHLVAALPPVPALASRLPEPLSRPEWLVWLGLSIVSMAVLIEFTRRAVNYFIQDDALSIVLSYLMPVAVYVSYVALPDAHRHSYPYDLPSLALLVGCIYYLLFKKYLQFWVFFVLATLSRETSILAVAFAIIVYVTENCRLTRSELALVGFLLVTWSMIKVFLKLLYADNLFEDSNMNEGGFFVFQLRVFVYSDHPWMEVAE